MKIKYRYDRESQGITSMETVVIVVLIVLIALLIKLLINMLDQIDTSDKFDTPNKIVSGVVKDARYYTSGHSHYIEVKFSDGRIYPLEIEEVPEIRIGVYNKFELLPATSGQIDKLISVVFEEVKTPNLIPSVPEESGQVEASSHYEPVIEKINLE